MRSRLTTVDTQITVFSTRKTWLKQLKGPFRQHMLLSEKSLMLEQKKKCFIDVLTTIYCFWKISKTFLHRHPLKTQVCPVWMAQLGIWYLVCCCSKVYQVETAGRPADQPSKPANDRKWQGWNHATMQIFFFSAGIKQMLSMFTYSWMDVYARVWA